LPSEDYTLSEIGEGVSAWVAPRGGWGHSNAALIAGHKASLLVDTLWDLPRTAAMLAAFRPQLESAPIAQVVNTHSDGDHWFGNQLTGAATIIATEAAASGMRHHGPGQMRAVRAAAGIFRAMRGDWRVAADYFDGMMRPFDFSNIAPVLPTATFSGKLQLEVGGRRVELIEVGPAHTAGDLVVYLPEDRILFAGDILFLGVTPVLMGRLGRKLDPRLRADSRVEGGCSGPRSRPSHGPVGCGRGAKILAVSRWSGAASLREARLRFAGRAPDRAERRVSGAALREVGWPGADHHQRPRDLPGAHGTAARRYTRTAERAAEDRLDGQGSQFNAGATPPTRMKSTSPSARVPSNSPKRVTLPLRRFAQLLSKTLELFESADPFLHRPAKRLIDQRHIHIALVPLDNLVDGTHGLPFHDTPRHAPGP